MECKLLTHIDFNRALHDMKYHDCVPEVTFGPYSPTYLIATEENADQDVKRYMYNGKEHVWITDFLYEPYNLVFDIKDGGDNPNNHYKIQRSPPKRWTSLLYDSCSL